MARPIRTNDSREAPSALPTWLRLVLPFVVFVASLFAFAPALEYDFVQLDDDRNFTARYNPNFHAGAHDLSGERLEWMFTQSHLGHYQPLTWVSLALDAELFGGFEPRVFHRTNLVLHGLNAVLVFFLCLALLRLALGGDPPTSEPALQLAALAGALFYGVHPLRTESVAWITERRDVLSSAFLLVSVLAYLRFASGSRARAGWMLLSLAGFVLSLFSKAWGITLPAVLLVLDLYPLRRREGASAADWRTLLLEKLGYVPLALVAAVMAARAQGDALALVSWDEHGPLQRLAQAAYGLVFYLVKTVLPVGLSPLYLLEAELDVTRVRYLASLAVVAALAALAFLQRRRLPALTAALAAYAILVSPVLGFLQSGAQIAADRYTYLASIPLSALLAGTLARALARARGPSLRARAGAAAAAVLALAALLVALSREQTRVWRDSESIFTRVVEVEPDNYFGQHCLSVVLRGQERYEDAIVHARASVAAHPRKGNEEARYNLGQLLRILGHPEAALEAFAEALVVAPDHLGCLKELVTEHLRAGRGDEAVAVIEDSLARQPEFLEGYVELARVQSSLGRPDLAEQAWQRGLQVAPGWMLGSHSLGVSALNRGDAAGAEAWFRRALRSGNDLQVLLDLGRALQAQGKHQEARSCYDNVLAYQPNNLQARELRSQLPSQ